MNRRLAAGLGLLALLLGLAVFSDSIAPHERGFMKAVRYDTVDGQEVMLVSPEPPSRFFLFGSDGWGYDLFSEMVHGLRWTLSVVFVTALLRSSAALAAGLALGALRPTGLRRRRFSPLASIPGFLLAAFVLYPATINSRLPPLALFAVQSGLLALVELPALAESFAARAADVLGRPFVEAGRGYRGYSGTTSCPSRSPTGWNPCRSKPCPWRPWWASWGSSASSWAARS